jgi:hypothetical protein
MRPTPPLAVATEFPDFDVLENASVMMPCGACGEHYPVTLREILLAQERLHAGCPAGSEEACPPLTYAALAEESALRDLVRSWTRVMRQVEAAGFDLTFRRPPLHH